MQLPDLQPGEHAVFVTDPSSIDRVAFCIRSGSLEIRDTLVLHTPEALVTALLVRQPLSGSILDTTVRHGLGTINIDACRVSVDDSEKGASREHGDAVYDGVAQGYQRKNKSCYTHKTDWQMKPDGRWPTNTILVHTTGCEKRGSKKIQPKEGHRANPVSQQADGRIQFNTKEPGYEKISYTDDDGREKVEDWDCEPGCPVKALDLLSGDRPSTLTAHGSGGAHPSNASYEDRERRSLHGGLDMPGSYVYGDSGGASRFYKQVESTEQLIWYLSTLIGSVDHVTWVTT